MLSIFELRVFSQLVYHRMKKPGFLEVNASILEDLRPTRFLCFFYSNTIRFDMKRYL